jgi:hypothetical protein
MRTRIRRRSRSGTLLPVVGSARLARPRWRSVFLLVGALLLVIGLVLSSIMVLMAGLILLGSAATGERSRAGLLSPTAAMVRGWMPEKRPDHLKRLPAESLPRRFGPP